MITTTRKTATRAGAAVGTAALLAVPVALLVPASAQADVERNGSCGDGRYELNVDREDGRFEVSGELDGVAPGSRWKVVMKHDGKRFASVTRTADNEGDLDVERMRPNTSGRDVFRFRASRVNGPASCSAVVTVR
jgi:hypothetical protein